MESKIILVTGGSGGIGYCTVKRLVDDGCFVVFTYASQEERAKEIEQEFLGKTKAVKYLASEDYNTVESLVNEIKDEYGKLDGLVNNLGRTNDKLLARMSTEDFTSIIDSNLVTAFNFSKAALKIMGKQKSGKIVNVASVVGVMGNLGQVNYSASKSAMYGMTKSMAKEYGRKGITINVVSPGFIKTPMTDVLSDSIKDSMLANIPMKRFGEPEEVSSVISFLLSEDSAYINGQNIIIDGGIL